ncbi:MAG TPA: DUF4148 domain-containing protein [Paraburkholderia sp.]|jgi:hypothetical protein|nr:DUF4148 domain-containing protein [Paraburkholderia sp.]
MKTLAIVALTGALASPALTYAQGNYEPVTRAQVRAELVQMEQAGYNPALADNAHYPDQIQAAEARVSAQNDAQDQARLTNDAMGGVAAGSSASGSPAATSYTASPYRAMPVRATSYGSGTGHGATPCQGPQSFCDIYSGGH